MAEHQLNEVSCMKAINGTNFSQGLQEYPFCIGRPNGFLPSQSYFKISMTITGKNGAIPPIEQKLAFADNCVSNLFSNVAFRAGGIDVSSVMNFVGQASAMQNRIQKTKAWTDSIGKSAYMQDPSFKNRASLTSSGVYKPADSFNRINVVNDPANATTIAIVAAAAVVAGVNTQFVTAGVTTGDLLFLAGEIRPFKVAVVGAETSLVLDRAFAAGTAATSDFYFVKADSTQLETGKNTISVIWTPPIGIMQCDQVLGAGEYKFCLNPNSDYKTSAVQSAIAQTVGTVDNYTNFDINITDIKLYVATVKLEMSDDEYELDLMEMNVQSKTITPDNQTNQFTIPSSTKYISVFFQANSSGTNTKYPPSLFQTSAGQEKFLTSLQLNYANLTKPNTRWDSVFRGATGLINQWQQRYTDNLREAGMIDSIGGAESFEDFLARGVFVHYSFERDMSDKATQLQLATSFSNVPGGTFTESTKVFVVCHYRRKVQIQVNNGMIVAVRSLDA